MYSLPSFCAAFSPQYDFGGPNQYPGTSNFATYDFPILLENRGQLSAYRGKLHLDVYSHCISSKRNSRSQKPSTCVVRKNSSNGPNSDIWASNASTAPHFLPGAHLTFIATASPLQNIRFLFFKSDGVDPTNLAIARLIGRRTERLQKMM